MENPALLLSIATFVVIILLLLAFNSLWSSRTKEQKVLERAVKYSAQSESSAGFVSPEKTVKKNPRFGLSNFLKKSTKETRTSYYADTPLFYQRAGIYNRKTIRSYQILRIILLLAPIGGFVFLHVFHHLTLNAVTLLVTFLVVTASYYLPVVRLRVVTHYRKKELYRTFPDAIDLLMVCVEAGMGVDAAIRRVSKEIFITSPELAKEFEILSLELKSGKSRNECLKNLALRTDLGDIDSLVSLMIQAEKYGTGVANALKIHAEEMRQKRFSRLEQLAAQLPVKMTVPLILFIFPAFFVVIMGPAAIQVFRNIIER
jgi:tight adherence protein C